MTATATATATERRRGIPYAFHAAAALWVCGMLALSRLLPVRYEALLQEDRFIEWWTVALFAAAATYRLRDAWPRRALFDLLVVAFCIFVAGEEFSWGQRLLGFTPPAAFLEHNVQQEFTVHNFADLFGQPKGVLGLALAGYALLALLPLAPPLRPLLRRLGATPPPFPAALWLAAAALLLGWYPADYTGEWVEALAGSIFLVSAPRASARGSAPFAGTAAAALLLTLVSGRGPGADPDRSACARREVEAIAADLHGGAALPDLHFRGSVHKRLYTSMQQGYVAAAALRGFRAVRCAGNARSRRAYGIDPWGTAYWIATERGEPGERLLTVYSMGPNRRRDEQDGRPAGDDIAAFAVLGRP